MVVLFGERLSKEIKRVLIENPVIFLVSPYISDFDVYGDFKGAKLLDIEKNLTEFFILQTLEEDGRVILITDKKSKERIYSKGILSQIKSIKHANWIFIYEVDKLHAKLFLGKREAILGSSNLTSPALRKNLELGKLIKEKKDIKNLKLFVGELIIKGKPYNIPAKKLKDSLKKNGLLKKELVCDVINLLSYSYYLYRTTKILCYWIKISVPRIVDELGKIIFNIEEEHINWDEYKKRTSGIVFTKKERVYLQKKINKKCEKIKELIKSMEKLFVKVLIEKVK